MRFFFLLYFSLILKGALSQFGAPHFLYNGDNLISRSAKAADLDGDTDLDAVYITAGMDGGKLYWTENLGGGIFDAEMTVMNGVGDSAHVELVDFDNDSDTDILIAIPNLDKVGWFSNNGSGVFSPLIEIFSMIGDACLVPEDFDQDGDKDLIVAFSHADKISVFENEGSELFGPEEILAFADYPTDICTADFDGDGDKDLAYVSRQDSTVAWFENISGVFGPEISLSEGLHKAVTIAAADINLDGDIDLVVGSVSFYEVMLFENLGSANFSSGSVIATNVSGTVSSIEMADLTGDTALEIIIHVGGLSGSGNIRWMINSSTGSFGPVLGPSTAEEIRSVYPADMDSDGDVDLLFSASMAGEVAYMENSATGDFPTEVLVSKLYLTPKMIAVADFNSDGLNDIASVSGNPSGDRLIWYANEGGDVFSDQKIITTAVNSPRSVLAVDIDNDGDKDIVVTSQGDDKVIWFSNDGNGNFGSELLITLSIDLPGIAESYDMDNDGDMDILVTSYNDKIYFIRNSSNGIFESPVLVTSLVLHPKELITADINSDGFNDLLTTSVGDDKLAWYENLGGIGFGSQTIISSTIPNPYGLITGDIDSDGDQDIVCGFSDSIKTYSNDGLANFSALQLVTTAVGDDIRLDLGDIDFDGDLDLVSYSSSPDALSFFENLGNGLFGPQDNFGTYDNINGNMMINDVDADGDLDVVYCADLLDRQIAWRENYAYHPTQVKGRLFVDMNQNFQHDSSDIGVNQFGVFSSPQSDFTFASTSGNYFMNFSDVDGFYVIQPDSLPYWSIVTDSLSYTIEVDTNFIALDSLDFGFYPDTLINSLSPELVGGFPRCNQVVNYWLSYANSGTTIPSGYIELVLDDDITYVSSVISPDSISGNSVYWSYDSLFYFSGGLINLQVQMPSFTSMGDTLESQLNIFVFDTLGNIVYMNTDSLSQILVCAYDPNDKTVEPVGISSFGYIAPETEFLEYVIRFQNTGNDTAINVVIQDMLDASLDWSTFTPLASSHYVHIDGDQSGQVTFTFPNIMLPDSNVNEIGSHGFIKYRISLLPDLTSGTVINNTANIFFDFNPAVITNTTINTIFDCAGLAEDAIYPSIICEGENVAGLIPDYTTDTQYEWIISAIDTIIGNELLWMANTSGMFDLTLKMSNDFCFTDTSLQFTINPTYYQNPDTLSICFGESALIFGQPQSVENLYHDTLQTFLGCDSVLSVFVKVNPAPLNLADTISICLGEDALIFGQTQFNEGLYYDTLQTILGCDSVLSIFLKVNMPYYNSPDTISICSGESALIFGGPQSVEGLYYDTLQTILGCDSVLSEFLDVLPLPLVEMDNVLEDTVCIYTSEISIFATPLGGEFSGSGITSNQFNPSLAGAGSHYLYYNYTDIDNCTATDSIYIYVDVCLTISEINLYNIQIQPNPFTDHIIISADDNLDGNYAVSICNMLGEVVYTNEMSINSDTSIHPADLTAGVYLISIVDISNKEIIFQGKVVAN